MSYQKLDGLYLFATIRIVKMLEDDGSENTVATPPWK